MARVLPDSLTGRKHVRCVHAQLVRFVYAHGNDNQKGQAMLSTVYFKCVCVRGARVLVCLHHTAALQCFTSESLCHEARAITPTPPNGAGACTTTFTARATRS